MDTLARNELFAKPEVKAAMAEVLEVVRRVLPEGNFAWREQATLAMLEEVGREVLEQELIAIAGREALPADQQNALDEHLVYIANNKDRMRYVTLVTSNLPIGSGVTESAAKTVIGRRTKNAGQRWKEPGLRGALNLRAIDQSDRLPRFWSYLSAYDFAASASL